MNILQRLVQLVSGGRPAPEVTEPPAGKNAGPPEPAAPPAPAPARFLDVHKWGLPGG
jgi:hypothetical protein